MIFFEIKLKNEYIKENSNKAILKQINEHLINCRNNINMLLKISIKKSKKFMKKIIY